MKKFRLLTLLALLMTAVTGVWADDWTDIIINGNMEGSDRQCFFVKENGLGSENLYYARIQDGIGKEGSRAILVQSSGVETYAWDTQFFLRLPYELPAGTKYRLTFDYKADVECECNLQSQNEPAEHIIWYINEGQSSPACNFNTDWDTYDSGELTVPADCDGSQTTQEGLDFKNNFQTISFNMAKNGQATQFIIDNIKVEILSSVASGLTKSPAPRVLPQYPVEINSMAIMGDFLGKGTEGNWNMENAWALTKDEDIWKLTKEFTAEAKTYEYKVFANDNMDDFTYPVEAKGQFVISEAGNYILNIFADPEGNTVSVKAVAPVNYAITLAEGTEDAGNWIVPAEAEEGATVTVTYEGTRKVKSVKAVKKVKIAIVSTAPTAKTGIKTGEDKAIINAGTAEGGTMYYAVTTTNAKPANIDGFSATVPTAKTLTAGTYYVWYYVKADDEHIDSEISATAIEVTIAKATPTFSVSPSTVSFASTDNVNATKQVTITYNGDGVLSVSSNNTNKVTASVNQSTKKITLTRKSVDGGTVTITVSAAAGTNYSAATDKTITVNMTAYITGKALKDASVGWKYGSDGKAYPADASLPTGVTVLGMVAYKSGSGGIVMRSTYHSEELSNWRADLAGSDPFGSTNAYTSSLSNTTSYEWRTGTQAEYKNCGLTSVSGFNTLNTRLQTAGCNKLENNRYLGAKDNKRFYSGDGEWESWNLSGTCLIRPIFVF